MKPGNTVRIDGIDGDLLVLDARDPSLLTVKTAYGALLRVGMAAAALDTSSRARPAARNPLTPGA